MKKQEGAVFVAWIAVIILAVSPAVLSAQIDPGENQKPNAAIRPIAATGTVVQLTENPMRAAVKGIGKTLNIGAVAFTPWIPNEPYQFWANHGYICGTSASAACLVSAPIVFPKGAKKIKYIDFCMYDKTGGLTTITIYDAWPVDDNEPYVLFNYTPPANAAGWTWYRWTPSSTSSSTIYPTDFYYCTLALHSLSGSKGIIVTYQ